MNCSLHYVKHRQGILFTVKIVKKTKVLASTYSLNIFLIGIFKELKENCVSKVVFEHTPTTVGCDVNAAA